MRRIWLLVVLFGLVAWPGVVLAQESGWVINSFASEIAIKEDGSVTVREQIKVDFGVLKKHGIFRDLPYVYSTGDGDSVYTRIENIVVEQDGAEAKVDVTKNSANIRIKIGDGDVTISGEHVYEISYRAIGVLRSFREFDELNWNVTGNDWGVPIKQVSAQVSVPEQVLQSACYQGLRGSRSACGNVEESEGKVIFAANNLSPGEGLTVAVGFEPGVVPIVEVLRPPTLADAIFAPVSLVVFVLVAVVGVGFMFQRWYRYGRDRYWQRAHLPGERSDRDGKSIREKILPLGYRAPVSVEYDAPDNLRPAEIGVLMDEKADTLDVSATIVDLAARGYLTISEVEKKWVFGKSDYAFNRTSKAAGGLLTYEKSLLNGMFEDGDEVAMSDLKNSFYKDLRQVKKELYVEVVSKKLFAKNPETVRALAIGLGIMVVVAGGILVGLLAVLVGRANELGILHYLLAGLAGGLLVTGVVGIVIGPFMPRKTGYGRELYERAKGYELFVSGTEKYRAKFYEDEGLFMRVLPYAKAYFIDDKAANIDTVKKAFPEVVAYFIKRQYDSPYRDSAATCQSADQTISDLNITI